MQVSLEAKRNGVNFRRPTFVNPLPKFFRAVNRTFEIAGYSRAAAELARLGYYEEAKNCMMQIKTLKKES